MPSPALGRPRSHGFSFVEVLIVISILVILVGIFLPLGPQTRKRAASSQDIQNLHQLAIGHMLYEDQFGDIPLSFAALVTVNPELKRVAASEQDTSRVGAANLLRSDWAKGSEDRLRRSYAMPSDIGMRPWLLRERFADCQNSGFFIDASGFAPKDETKLPAEIRGPYHRALRDGAVVTRTVRRIADPPHSTYLDFTSLFCDATDEQIKTWMVK